MAWTFEATKQGYGNMWRSAKIKAGRDQDNADAAVRKILALESDYRAAFAGAGMPWYFGAAIHYREADNDLRGCMVNGEKIVGTDRKTTIVPEGRGPYSTFRDSVQDAATLKGWRNIAVWSIERFLYLTETYNGIGYVSKGINAPYVWAGTNHEEMGLYVRDHVFDQSVEDTRLGTAAIILKLIELRPDIATEIVSETQQQMSALPPPSDTMPLPPSPPIGSGQQMDATQQLLAQIVPLLLRLMSLQLQPQPPQPTPQVHVTTQVPASVSAPSALEKPSVGIGALLTALVGGMQYSGSAPPPNTMSGFLSLAVPAAMTALGATTPGGWVGIATGVGSAILRLIGTRNKEAKS